MASKSSWLISLLFAGVFGVWMIPVSLEAHCDTMDGPVIRDAREALLKGDVTPVLKWVRVEYERDMRDVFAKVLLVRAAGKEARELADMYFFENLVRLHRAGEGELFTGIKPAGRVEPIVTLSDKALESGQIEELVRKLTDVTAAGIRRKFHMVIEAQKHANESIQKGREFVESYVLFVHYVEGIHEAVSKGGSHHTDREIPSEKHK